MGKDQIQDGRTISELELQTLLMERVDRLQEYIARRIPADIRRVVGPEDVLQEVWVAVFRGIGSFQADGADGFDRWLTTVTQRKLLDVIRDARRLKRGGGRQFDHNVQRRTSSYLDLFARISSGNRTPSSEDAACEAAHAVQIALCSLPEDYRAAITLRHLHGRAPAAIAKAMSKTQPAVRGLLYRGLLMMRERMEPAGRFFSDD